MAYRLRRRSARYRVTFPRLSYTQKWSLLIVAVLSERVFTKVDWNGWWTSLPDDKMESFSFLLENWWNAQGGPPHPHKGARDEFGNLGYVQDVHFVKNNRIDLDINRACHYGPPYGEGVEGPNGFLALNKIQISGSPSTANTSVMCIVYTHSNRHDVLQAIVETWGRHCDGFLAASNKTDRRLGAINLLHAGPEAYSNMWQKVRSTWAYVYDHYLHHYGYFHIGGDNMFLLLENLKLALAETNHPPQHPLLLGGAFIKFPNKKRIYCGGGSGYTLNRAALQQLIENRFNNKICYPHRVTSGEDIMIASCLDRITKCRHSVDFENRTRYFPLSPEFHASWTQDRGGAIWSPKELLDYHKISATSREKLDGISTTAVSFHLTEMNDERDSGMRRLYGILYNKCQNRIEELETKNMSA